MNRIAEDARQATGIAMGDVQTCERPRCRVKASRRAEKWFQFPRDPARYVHLCEECFWEMIGAIEKQVGTGRK